MRTRLLQTWCISLLAMALMAGCGKKTTDDAPAQPTEQAAPLQTETTPNAPQNMPNADEISRHSAFMTALMDSAGLGEFDCHDLMESEMPAADTLDALFKQHSDLNAPDAEGNTVLMKIAACHGAEGSDIESTEDHALLYELIKRGADITQPRNDGKTVLMETHFLRTAKAYLEAKGDVNAKTKQGSTALLEQLRYREQMNCTPFFMEEGTMGCANEEENDGKCLTHADIRRNEMHEIVKLLLDAGADVNAQDETGTRATMLDEEMLLVPGADVNAVDREGRSVLMRLIARAVLMPENCTRPDAEIAKKLKDKGADIHYINPKTGDNALTFALKLRKNILDTFAANCLDEAPDAPKAANCLALLKDEEIVFNPAQLSQFLPESEVASLNDMLSSFTMQGDINDFKLTLFGSSLHIIESLLELGGDTTIKTKDGQSIVPSLVMKEDKYVIDLFEKH